MFSTVEGVTMRRELGSVQQLLQRVNASSHIGWEMPILLDPSGRHGIYVHIYSAGQPPDVPAAAIQSGVR